MLSPDPRWTKMWAAYSSAAFVKVALLLGALWCGIKIDKRLGTSPLFLMVFVVLAMGLGLWYLMMIVKRKP
jgi:F0F1-type ATP synthase assembly protein I